MLFFPSSLEGAFYQSAAGWLTFPPEFLRPMMSNKTKFISFVDLVVSGEGWFGANGDVTKITTMRMTLLQSFSFKFVAQSLYDNCRIPLG